MTNKPEGKSKAIIAYLTFIGLFIAISMNRDPKDAFATWHIKNMFGLVLLLFVSLVFQYNELFFIGDILYVIALVCWVYSLIMAQLNKMQGIPYLSKKFQDWFTFLG